MKMHRESSDKQIKLVIVDDEPLVIEGLKSMIDWQKYNIIVTQTFEQSELAFDYIVHNPVDLLITDVRMPGMDGLELIRQIKLLQPRLKVLVMSGYRDFEYVKLAMTHGAKNYLVKPVFEEDLNPLLLEIQKEIDSHIMEAYYSESCQTENLKKFLLDKETLIDMPSRALMDYFNEIFTNGEWQLCAFWKNFDKIDHETILSLVGVNADDWIELLYQSHGMVVLVNCDAKLLEDKLVNQKYITQWDSHRFQGDLQHLKILYQAYLHILPRCHHYQKNTKMRLVVDDSFKNKKLQSIPIERVASEFVEVLQLCNTKLLNEKIQESLDTWDEMEFEIDIFLSTIILLYETIVEKTRKLIDINCVEAGVFDISLPLHMCTIEDIVVFFEDKLFILLSILDESKACSKDSFKIRVETFINEQYAQNISIKELADYVHMHPTYLGQKLSQLWGEGFTQRLHRIRIQKSVDYLKKLDNQSIEDIACKVGYQHYHVFLKYFKKYMEKTPKEYVRQLRL